MTNDSPQADLEAAREAVPLDHTPYCLSVQRQERGCVCGAGEKLAAPEEKVIVAHVGGGHANA